MYQKAFEEDDRDEAFKIWIVNYQNMDKDTYESFDNWYKRINDEALNKAKLASESKEDILANVAAIRKKVGEKQNGNI